jgi:general secretion pathway protein E
MSIKDELSPELTAEELLNSFHGYKFTPKTSKERDSVQLLTDIYNRGYISKDQVQLILAKYEITKKSIGSLLIANGFISQHHYHQIILEVKPDLIINEETISDTIDFKILQQTKTMIQAETNSKIYVSTIEKERVVRNLISEYTKGKEIVFNNAKFDVVDEYLSKLEKMDYQDVSFLDNIIRKAMREGASDIHILPPDNGSYSIRFRVDGMLHHYHEGEEEQYYKLLGMIKNRAAIDSAERKKPQDGSFQIENKGRYIDLRVATNPAGQYEVFVLRLLDPDGVSPDITKLGITGYKEWNKGTSGSSGINFICGPTGSGKTTTQQATIRGMDRYGQAIYTIEDPVEIRIPGVRQTSVNELVNYTFKNAVKSFMRSDPDVIIIGEIRDEETARNAIKAAQTGHLVLATLHTNSIIGVIARLRDIGIDPKELTDLLNSILVQRLVRVLCKTCNGKGCSDCSGRGYKGRTIVSECAYFKDEKAVQDLIDGKVNWQEIVDDAVMKVLEGVTDAKEIIRVFGEEGRVALRKQGIEVEDE